jgi:hypothetical protein
LIATVLGIWSGLADARAGRRRISTACSFIETLRGELVRTGFETVVNLLLMGILLDASFQWVILGVSHPGAALVVGPVLIVLPYSLTRALEPPRVPTWAPEALTSTGAAASWRREGGNARRVLLGGRQRARAVWDSLAGERGPSHH